MYLNTLYLNIYIKTINLENPKFPIIWNDTKREVLHSLFDLLGEESLLHRLRQQTSTA